MKTETQQPTKSYKKRKVMKLGNKRKEPDKKRKVRKYEIRKENKEESRK